MKYTIVIEKHRGPGIHGISEGGILAEIVLPYGITEFEAAFRLGLLAMALEFNIVSKADPLPRFYKNEALRMGAYLRVDKEEEVLKDITLSETIGMFLSLNNAQRAAFKDIIAEVPDKPKKSKSSELAEDHEAPTWDDFALDKPKPGTYDEAIIQPVVKVTSHLEELGNNLPDKNHYWYGDFLKK